MILRTDYEPRASFLNRISIGAKHQIDGSKYGQTNTYATIVRISRVKSYGLRAKITNRPKLSPDAQKALTALKGK